MNQILSSNKNNKDFSVNTVIRKKSHFNFFKFQFIFCLVLCIFISAYYFYLQYDKKKNESLSEGILNNFSITSLYENYTTDYSTSLVQNSNSYQANSLAFSVVGLIEIKAIGINYPIINEFSYDLLKIAPCKFFGPNPNEVGNLCIAGHNYNNYQFFSRLKKLQIGDIISIYDLSRSKSKL